MKDEDEKEVTGPPDQFVGRDLLESYMYYRNYMPSNPIETYIVKRKCIEFGKELLPSFIDPDETDEEQKKKNQKKQDTTDELYKKACEVLTTAIPSKRQIRFKYLDKNNRVYELLASDANDCEVKQEELETVMNNFTNQQHEQHIGALAEVDNGIFHVLSMTGIVPAINPTIDQMINEKIKEAMGG